MAKIARALLSVTDKTGLAGFAKVLAGLGVELISTGGTAKLLREAGLAVKDVSEVTGFPEMLDGRVKTIHPCVAGGVLAMRSKPEHMAAIAEHGIPAIDMVVVNLYQFEKVAAREGVSREELIENIDIGGPTMIRAAAKNWQDVAVVTSAGDYESLAAELQATGGELSEATHWRLMVSAFELTASYDRAIAAKLRSLDAAPEELPLVLDVKLPLKMGLRYGENPHQKAALYGTGESGIAGAWQLQGKELSYNNLVDLDAAWQLIQEFDAPACAIIKHTNPCGCAEGATVVEAYQKALEADPISAFGGVLAFNRTVDGAAAAEVAKLFTEAIAAPGYTDEALAAFAAKKNLRLLTVGAGGVDAGGLGNAVVKSISGGMLVQSADTARLERANAVVRSRRQPTEEEWRALEFGWKVVKHVKSNAIVYARAGQLVSSGAGQMSRVDSVKVGAMKAVLPVKGTVLASDAFFPFPDGVVEAASHGITAVIHPGGSVKDAEVIAKADELGLAVVLTGVRHFRH